MHPFEHVLFDEEIARALKITPQELMGLVARRKISRGISVLKGYGWRPHFTSLFNLIEYIVAQVLEAGYIGKANRVPEVREFLDALAWWIGQGEHADCPANMKSLLLLVNITSCDASQVKPNWEGLDYLYKDGRVVLDAFREWSMTE